MSPTGEMVKQAEALLQEHPELRNRGLDNPERATGACGLVSTILAELLKNSSPQVRMLHLEDPVWERHDTSRWSLTWQRTLQHSTQTSHAVVYLGDGVVLDATARQFDHAKEGTVLKVLTLQEVEQQWGRIWHVDPDYRPKRVADRGGYYTPEDYQELLDLN